VANIARLQKDMNSATKTVDSAMAKITKSVDMAQKALGALGIAATALRVPTNAVIEASFKKEATIISTFISISLSLLAND